MAIRPPKYNSQGFTLVEMLVTILVGGILMTFAVPSLLSLNKPLRDGAVQFKSHLNIVRSKAITSNKAYRLKPRYLTRAEYEGGIPHRFLVEYATTCSIPVTTKPEAGGWQRASQFDLDLPPSVGITDIEHSYFTVAGTPPVTLDVEGKNKLDWTICFDNRGIIETPRQVVLKDFKSDNKAKIAFFDIHKLGGINFKTYGVNASNNYGINTDLHDNQSMSNPTF